MGGYGAYDLLARHPGQFAAATIVCGGGDVERAAAIGTVPLRLYHGARDPLVTVRHSRTMVAALTAAGAAPEYQEYASGGHNIWDQAFCDAGLRPWLFAHQQPAAEDRG